MPLKNYSNKYLFLILLLGTIFNLSAQNSFPPNGNFAQWNGNTPAKWDIVQGNINYSFRDSVIIDGVKLYIKPTFGDTMICLKAKKNTDQKYKPAIIRSTFQFQDYPRLVRLVAAKKTNEALERVILQVYLFSSENGVRLPIFYEQIKPMASGPFPRLNQVVNFNENDFNFNVLPDSMEITIFSGDLAETDTSHSLIIDLVEIVPWTNLSHQKLSSHHLFNFYPNPSKGKIAFQFNEPNTTLRVINSQGQSIFKKIYKQKGLYFEDLMCPAGKYYIRLRTIESVYQDKLIILE